MTRTCPSVAKCTLVTAKAKPEPETMRTPFQSSIVNHQSSIQRDFSCRCCRRGATMKL